MTFSLRSVSLVFVYLLSSCSALTQVVPQAKVAANGDAFSGESYVIERSTASFHYMADGTGWRERTVAVRIQSEAALRELGVVALPFASASEHVEFHYARVRRPDGTRSETPLGGVQEQPEAVTREAPFYSDAKEAQLPIKNLRVGDTLEWEARIVRTRAEAPGYFWGAENFVTEGAVARNQCIELWIPAGVDAKVWTNPRLGLAAKEEIKDGAHIYRWTYEALHPTFGAAAEAEKSAKKKHVRTADEELDEDQGALPSIAWTTFKSWAEVGAWYRGLEGERAKPDDEVQAKVAELTAGKTNDLDKALAVYAYVSSNIQYIGVAFGVGRYQPHEAVDVLHNQYGDCKDKAMLLSSMLAALGQPSDAVLIGASIRFNDAVPSPAAFNHLITHLKLHDHDVWMDATEEIAPAGMMWPTLRDRQALVVPERGAATILRTPAAPPFPSFDRWDAKGALDKEGTSNSHIRVELRGDDELVMRTVLRQIAPAQYEEAAQRMVNSFGYAGTTSHAEFSRPEDNEKPFVMEFDYRREKGGDWDNLRILPQLEPVSLPMAEEKEPPVRSIALGAPRTETSTSEIALPAGWTAELPDAVHRANAYVSYDLAYRFENGTLFTQRKISVLKNKVPVDDAKVYAQWVAAVGLGTETFVQLHRLGSGAAATLRSGHNGNAAQLQPLYTQLDQAYKAQDTKEMEELLKRIKSIDPKARRLLAWSAALALLRNKPDEAIDENWKELALYPDEFDRYGAIVYVQQRWHKPGAEDTLRKWAAADAANPAPLMDLAQMQMTNDHSAEAVESATRATALAGDNPSLAERAHFLLGKSQLKAGMTEKGTATLLGLLDASDDAGILNDAAYELADANLELPKAEAASRKGLGKLNAVTESWTLDESPTALKATTSLLLASWDTLGWILYREHKYQEAHSYLVAALLGRTSKDVKDHLQKERAALMAGASNPGAGLPADDPEVHKGDQELRTIPLGPSDGRHGTAEYKLLLANGRIVRMEPAEVETIAGADKLLKAANLQRFFPAGSTARLFRVGMMNCVAGQCDIVLEP